MSVMAERGDADCCHRVDGENIKGYKRCVG